MRVELDAKDLELLDELERLDGPGRAGEGITRAMRREERQEAVTVLLGVRLAHKALAARRDPEGTGRLPAR
jgi:hypothetical protein